MSGLRFGAVMGTATGAYSGYKYAKDNGLNPLSGKMSLKQTTLYDFTLDAYGDNVKLYRGMTGSENGNKDLFMTTDPKYAASYSKNGTVIEIVMPRSTLFQMEQNGAASRLNGTYTNGTGLPSLEYRFTPPAASQIIYNYNIKP